MEPAPVFIKIEQYKELIEILNAVDQKISESTALLRQLEKLKAEEDAQLKAWTLALDDVKTRSTELNRALFANK
jgi:hypothetical protein